MPHRYVSTAHAAMPRHTLAYFRHYFIRHTIAAAAFRHYATLIR